MDKIFDYDEIEKTAYINWRTRIHDPLLILPQGVCNQAEIAVICYL
ncbi:hypothetical protein [Clostridium sp. C105KSO13]|nr:hypothetical protein [Clostridium sp. C105KSO13]CUX48140.1 hypothetical protein BN3456_02733 [Clostridium sp. C105KSO13]